MRDPGTASFGSTWLAADQAEQERWKAMMNAAAERVAAQQAGSDVQRSGGSYSSAAAGSQMLNFDQSGYVAPPLPNAPLPPAGGIPGAYGVQAPGAPSPDRTVEPWQEGPGRFQQTIGLPLSQYGTNVDPHAQDVRYTGDGSGQVHRLIPKAPSDADLLALRNLIDGAHRPKLGYDETRSVPGQRSYTDFRARLEAARR